MQFSIGALAPSILVPLRYYFSKKENSGSNLVWDPDEKNRTIDIFEAFDDNRTPLGERPRIVVSRGAFNIGKTGVTDNLAEGKMFSLTRGTKDYTNMVFYQGAALITVEARNKGTCELLADMASHFIVWSRPVIMDAHGWKEFGMPLSVTDCIGQVSEDPDLSLFQVQIQVPWMKEEQWRLRNDGAELKKVLLDVYLDE